MNEWPENYESLDDTAYASQLANMAPVGKRAVAAAVVLALVGVSGLTYAGDVSPLAELLSWKSQIAEQWGAALGSGALTF